MTISTFSPTRNEFVYSHSVKVYALGFDKLLESIFCILLVETVFPAKVVKMLEEVVGGQVNVADEAKLCSLIHLTFEVLVVRHGVGRVLLWRRIGPILLISAGCRRGSF